MIKFFRKIRQQLLSQNRFSKYLLYAVGEIILVMIGILLALKVNNYNIEVKNHEQEQRLLEQLHEEFILNKKQLGSIHDRNTILLQNINKVLEQIPLDIETVNLDSLSAYILKACEYYSYDPSYATIEELKSSSFNLISDKKLRLLLLQWDTVLNDYLDDERFSIEFSTNEFNTYMYPKVSFAKGLKHSKSELSFLRSIHFENLFQLRYLYQNDIVNNSDFDRLETTIDSIIDFTKPTIIN